MKKNEMNRWFWVPVILIILIILFLALFSLDVFDPGVPFLKQILGFLIHNIPSIVLIILLFVSWKYPKIGGIIIIVFSLVLTVFFHTYQRLDTFLMVSFPILLDGILFIVIKKDRKSQDIKLN